MYHCWYVIPITNIIEMLIVYIFALCYDYDYGIQIAITLFRGGGME